MNEVVSEFRSTIDHWFEVPCKGIPKSAILVGLGVNLHRNFDGFEVHRYPEGETLRINDAPKIPLIGEQVPFARYSDLFVYSRYDDEINLYRQVRAVHDPYESTTVSRALDSDEAVAALRIATNPILSFADIELLSVVSPEEVLDIESGALSVAGLHSRINSRRRAMDETLDFS